MFADRTKECKGVCYPNSSYRAPIYLQGCTAEAPRSCTYILDLMGERILAGVTCFLGGEGHTTTTDHKQPPPHKQQDKKAAARPDRKHGTPSSTNTEQQSCVCQGTGLWTEKKPPHPTQTWAGRALSPGML